MLVHRYKRINLCYNISFFVQGNTLVQLAALVIAFLVRIVFSIHCIVLFEPVARSRQGILQIWLKNVVIFWENRRSLNVQWKSLVFCLKNSTMMWRQFSFHKLSSNHHVWRRRLEGKNLILFRKQFLLVFRFFWYFYQQNIYGLATVLCSPHGKPNLRPQYWYPGVLASTAASTAASLHMWRPERWQIRRQNIKNDGIQ